MQAGDRITHNKVGLAGTQTKRQSLPVGHTPGKHAHNESYTHTHVVAQTFKAKRVSVQIFCPPVSICLLIFPDL